MAVAVVAVGLALASPARTVIGSAPELPGLQLPGLQAVEIASRSGSMLHGWLVPGRPGGGAVLLMHGVRSNRQIRLFNKVPGIPVVAAAAAPAASA
jgi:hypothetical protein